MGRQQDQRRAPHAARGRAQSRERRRWRRRERSPPSSRRSKHDATPGRGGSCQALRAASPDGKCFRAARSGYAPRPSTGNPSSDHGASTRPPIRRWRARANAANPSGNHGASPADRSVAAGRVQAGHARGSVRLALVHHAGFAAAPPRVDRPDEERFTDVRMHLRYRGADRLRDVVPLARFCCALVRMSAGLLLLHALERRTG